MSHIVQTEGGETNKWRVVTEKDQINHGTGDGMAVATREGRRGDEDPEHFCRVSCGGARNNRIWRTARMQRIIRAETSRSRQQVRAYAKAPSSRYAGVKRNQSVSNRKIRHHCQRTLPYRYLMHNIHMSMNEPMSITYTELETWMLWW